jgi:hypothetical protein
MLEGRRTVPNSSGRWSHTFLKNEKRLPCLGSFEFNAFLLPPFPVVLEVAGGFLVAGALEMQ